MQFPLYCPVCKTPLVHKERTFSCPNNHHFDQAKSGYINLFLTQKTNHGDDSSMILARHSFLNQGYYQPLRDKVISIIEQYPHQLMIDCGCGEGYYTKAIQEQLQNKILAIDLSKKALSLLKGNSDIQPVVASINQIPVQDQSLELALNIFAPLYLDEIKRILEPRGYIVLVYAGENHLLTMKEALYPQVRLNPPYPIDMDDLEQIHQETLAYTINLKQHAIAELLAMTPYTYKTPLKDLERVKSMPELDVSLQFEILVLRKKS